MRTLKSLACAAAVTVGIVASSAIAQTTTISGAGATFPFPLYSKWADTYKKETGIGLNYQSIGSGAGIKQIQAKTVTFGATDAPLKGDQLDKDGLLQFPMVMGGVVPIVNLDGIKPGELVIDGETFAKIYMGEIKTWDAPELKKLNPNAKLPSMAVAPVYRSDGSGTTFLFTDYLSKVSPAWKEKIGSSTSVKWPIGIGGKGNEGVAATVSQTKGGIGYVEFAYAKVNKATHLNMVNKNGKTVAPELTTFQAAAANADWASVPGFGVILTNQAGDQAWPITGATFILMHKKAEKPADSKAALEFFKWALEKGDEMAEELAYVPMPDAVVKKIEAVFPQIVGADGKPLVN
jgi:phosphate transport system substrate-binding protein